ncbi:MAG: hypothetical protein KY396_04110, partial [Actinobacteria bacterium]|nr:hypothetical protein [Actinomycetota bacterium]
EEASGTTFWVSLVATLALSIAGIALAWLLYGRRSDAPRRVRSRAPWAVRALEHKLYWDEAYDTAFYRPSSRLGLAGRRFVEDPLFLRSLGVLGGGVRGASARVAAAQTGLVRSYVLALAAGVAVMAVVFVLAR